MSSISASTRAWVRTLTVDGLEFRDLDHDGVLAPYEDWRLSADERVDDLLGRMTVEERAATLVHGTLAAAPGHPLAVIGVGEAYDVAAARHLVVETGVTSAIVRLASLLEGLAAQNNVLQSIAAEGRLGIPMTVSSDPRHQAGGLTGTSHAAHGFSCWPGPLGFGATRDAGLMREYGDAIRREYRAVGIHMSLAPQADLATSPRWGRIDGTFGEDPHVVRLLVGAYVEGVQGGRSGIGPSSVAAIVKHWVGYGASPNGFDGHNYYGRFSEFPTGAFDDHVEAFGDALAFGVAGVMPTYTILRGLVLDGEPVEPVAGGFNRQVIEGLLRGRHGFGGMVLSDWGITRDANDSTRFGTPPQTPADIATCWGVEDLTKAERFAKCINAGCDQIGGEDDPAPVMDAYRAGLLDERRITAAARQVLIQKFQLGLFDDPFVDEAAAADCVAPAAQARAAAAHREALVSLRRSARAPLSSDDTVYVSGFDADAFTTAGLATTDDPAQATYAVVRVDAPRHLLHPNFFFGSMLPEGDLDFAADHPVRVAVEALSQQVPTAIVAELDRPAVLAGVIDHADQVLAAFGAPSDAIVDVLTGRATATGRLPFRLARTNDDVLTQPCDRPDETIPAAFVRGHSALG